MESLEIRLPYMEELKSKPKTYYRKELHFIKDLGYVKVSLNTKDADERIRIC